MNTTGTVVAAAPAPHMPATRPAKPTVRIIREAKVTELPALRDIVR
jgi:hypothetical protein